MKYRKSSIVYGALGSVFMCILLQEVQIWAILLGFVSSILFSMFLQHSFQEEGPFSFSGYLISYYLLLIKDMFVSACKLSTSVFKKEVDGVEIMVFHNTKELKEEIRIANSITLTPGTLTIDCEEDYCRVLYLNQSEQKDFVGTFENRMTGGRKHD